MSYPYARSLETHSFISPDRALAPQHPLSKNLGLPLPSWEQASIEEIRAIQLNQRIPGVVKRVIPFDADTTWEYWWVVPGRLLLPEDVELLNRDRDRIETILSQLIWLLGGYCFAENSQRHGDLAPIYDWHKVLDHASHQGFISYLLDIDYLPSAIKLYHPNPNSQNVTCDYVAVEPPHWHIEFFTLKPLDGGFEIEEPKKLCSCQIWTGKPFLKHRKTGQALTQYDLWVSKPLDITNPPWRPYAKSIEK